jgi:hypothetical protein
MLSGATCRAAAIDGTAVFKMVVSSDSMKNATATSQGKRVFTPFFLSGALPPSRTFVWRSDRESHILARSCLAWM